MARPVRSASLRAKQLIAAGFTVEKVDAIGAPGLTPEEEDELNQEISGEIYSDFPAFEKDEDSIETSVRSGEARNVRFSTYEDLDVQPPSIKFRPPQPPGLHLSDCVTRSGIRQFTRAVDFFQLFITDELLQTIADNTNLYGWLNIHDKPSYAKPRDGSWEETCVQELKNLIAVLVFHGFAGRKDIERNWSQATLYRGGWSRRFLSKNRFKALCGMLHVSRPGEEDADDKLAKIRLLLDHLTAASQKYFQPVRDVSIDERMVASKGRTPLKQYMPCKPTRYGYKLWCMCDARTGYTIDFSVYVGRSEERSTNGLGYDVVSSLIDRYINCGYVVYCDNFFTSIPLAKNLLEKGTLLCGTMQPWRRGFPTVLKGKQWTKHAQRGDMRYVRMDDALAVQWFDKRVVNVLSTLHRGNDHIIVVRRGKDKKKQYQHTVVRMPTCVRDYNKNMGGVDLADQLIESYNCLMKVTRWWKTLFFHAIDVSIVNAFLLFKMWRSMHPEVPELSRRKRYSQLDFREELVRQLARIHDDEPIPVYNPTLKRKRSLNCSGPHDIWRNCRVCYILHGQQNKSLVRCSDMQCQVHLCLNKKRNCFPIWHSASFDVHRLKRRKEE